MRLTLIASGALFVALVVGAFALTTVLSRTRIDALDTVVRERVATIAALAEDDRLPDALPVAEPGEIAQLLDARGGVVATSPNASRTLPVQVRRWAAPAPARTTTRPGSPRGCPRTGASR
jgi:hypothetical protein